jgi:hypothetical protein
MQAQHSVARATNLQADVLGALEPLNLPGGNPPPNFPATRCVLCSQA